MRKRENLLPMLCLREVHRCLMREDESKNGWFHGMDKRERDASWITSQHCSPFLDAPMSNSGGVPIVNLTQAPQTSLLSSLAGASANRSARTVTLTRLLLTELFYVLPALAVPPLCYHLLCDGILTGSPYKPLEPTECPLLLVA